MAITPKILTLAEQIAELKAKVERLSRPSPPPVGFAAYQTVVQDMPTGWTAIKLDTVVRDTAGTFTTGSEYVCQAAGWYWISGMVGWANNATTFRASRLQVNGNPIPGSAGNINASSDWTCLPTPATLVHLAVGDYVELAGYTPGATTTGVTFVPYRSRLNLVRVG